MPFFTDESITGIAKKHNVATGQVLISYIVQRGLSTIPKSEQDVRLKQNITVRSTNPSYVAVTHVCRRIGQLIQLDSDDMKVLNEYHKKPSMHKSLVPYHVNGTVLGWTYEQLGWNMHGNGLVKDE